MTTLFGQQQNTTNAEEHENRASKKKNRENKNHLRSFAFIHFS